MIDPQVLDIVRRMVPLCTASYDLSLLPGLGPAPTRLIVASYLPTPLRGQRPVFGFVQFASDCTYVAFRGTESVADWPDDIDLCQTQSGVHSGFQAVYDAISDGLNEVLRTADRNLPLVFTGHSLGAALATIAAYQRPRSRLITFASPRVGSKMWAKLFSGCSLDARIANQFDIFTHLPARPLFEHVDMPAYTFRGGTPFDLQPHELKTYATAMGDGNLEGPFELS